MAPLLLLEKLALRVWGRIPKSKAMKDKLLKRTEQPLFKIRGKREMKSIKAIH